jgi:2-polyprenyl-6-methoxyphenol hydroxylase-like FAD-dependent oxidoreductase
MARYNVIIVGGGPVGVGLAVELGQRGVSCLVVERHLQPQQVPKGQSLSNRTLEHFYFWNCVDELRRARVLPPGYPIGGVTIYNTMTSGYSHSTQADGARGQGVQDYYFQANERLPQYLTETVLRERLKQIPNVTTLLGWVAEKVEQDENGTRVTIAPANEGATAFSSWSADTEQQNSRDALPESEGRQVIEADYLVGCDGGRSLVRETLGIQRVGRDFHQRMVLAVLRSPDLHALTTRFPDATTFRIMNPDLNGVWQFFGRIDVGEGFFYHGPVPDSTTADNYDFVGLLREVTGEPIDVEFDHIGFWDLRVAVADKYGEGRIFIAGDAAHQHPPYGGFGLNTGLEDATNLGWKLAANLQGWGGKALLDSYGEERRPIFAQTGENVIAAGIDQEGEYLARYNPDVDLEEFKQNWLQPGRARRAPYNPNYQGSSVIMGPEGASIGINAPFSLKAEAGFHLAPRTLSSGKNVFEELGSGLTLVALDAPDNDVATLEAAAKALNAPLKVIRDTIDGGRDAYEARFVLVRPDQYVAWTGNEAPADATAMLTKVLGLA